MPAPDNQANPTTAGQQGRSIESAIDPNDLDATGADADSEPTAEGGDGAEGEEQPTRWSRPFALLQRLFAIGLTATFVFLLATLILVLDFLDLLQFRYRVPEDWRQKWPIHHYYELVRRHQLPDEERFRLMIQEERDRYARLMQEGSESLKQKAQEQERNFSELIRFQQEKARTEQQRALSLTEDNLREKQRLETLARDLEMRKQAVDLLTQQVASEAAMLEASLIQFMEHENRLRSVQKIASMMDPIALATILNEVSDNQLIYNVLQGVPPPTAGRVLGAMDPEKAGKIIKMSEMPPSLPRGGRPYLPASLQNLVASSQSLLR